VTYIISYFDTNDCTHNGDESPKHGMFVYTDLSPSFYFHFTPKIYSTN